MRNRVLKCSIQCLITALILFYSQALGTPTAEPSLFINLQHIEENRLTVERNHDILKPAVQKLLKKAEIMLSAGPYSVVYGKANPAGGDPHDYCSMSPYWWPDPDKPDGLPYIRKDGQVNPERNLYDKPQSADFHEAVETLTLAYLYSNDSRFAQRAVYLIRVWFLEDSTHMNPNMTYAQFIPGRSKGRNFGIIESRNFLYVLDYASILYFKGELSSKTYDELMQWGGDFLDWLMNSDHGIKERKTSNNHGTWFDVQAMGFACLAKRVDVMQEIAGSFYKTRIKKHVLKDGRQPEELERTRSFSYSVFNLRAMTQFYQLAYGADILPDKERVKMLEGINRAVDYLFPYSLNPESWPYEQLRGFDGGRAGLVEVLLVLNRYHPDGDYLEKARRIPLTEQDRDSLILRYGMI
jgi:hypothetical protein